MSAVGGSDVPFYIVDVFTKERFQGNPLAVVLGQFNPDLMLAITREMNYSETIFLGSPEQDGTVPVRIFTPGGEIPFAGHPTLGAAFVLREIRAMKDDPLTLREGVGPIAVRQEGAIYWMHQNPPQFETMPKPELIADMLGLRPTDIDETLPIETVSTGLPALIVPLKSIDACQRAWLNTDRYRAVGDLPASVLVFAPGAAMADHDLHVRVFVSQLGIPEDPATGSANGSLAGYLCRHGVFGERVDVVAEQGLEMGRPSSLHLRAERMAGTIHVEVGGAVQAVAQGWLAIADPINEEEDDDATV